MDDQPKPRPAFAPVPLRARRDGWTAERQREFIRILHLKRSISAACRAVGLSRKSAYKLRERPGAEGFAAAWDSAFALRPAPARTNFSQLWYRACFKVKPVIRGGRQVGTIEQPDNAAALKLYHRLERNCRNADRRTARRRDGNGR
jgi:hypothetical protein